MPFCKDSGKNKFYFKRIKNSGKFAIKSWETMLLRIYGCFLMRMENFWFSLNVCAFRLNGGRQFSSQLMYQQFINKWIITRTVISDSPL